MCDCKTPFAVSSIRRVLAAWVLLPLLALCRPD
jgi:hypothetical protein